MALLIYFCWNFFITLFNNNFNAYKCRETKIKDTASSSAYTLYYEKLFFAITFATPPPQPSKLLALNINPSITTEARTEDLQVH